MVNQRRNTIGTFIDLKKAFGDYEILFKNLKFCGITRLLNNWLYSYLMGNNLSCEIILNLVY